MWNQVGLLVGKKRATFNTDLSPFESAQRYFVPNGRSMLSSEGKSGLGFVYCGDCEDQHQSVNELRWRKKEKQIGQPRVGQCLLWRNFNPIRQSRKKRFDVS